MFFPSMSHAQDTRRQWKEENVAYWIKRGHELEWEKQTTMCWSPEQHQEQLSRLSFGRLWAVQVTRLVKGRTRIVIQNSRVHSNLPTLSYHNPLGSLFSLLFLWMTKALLWLNLYLTSLSSLLIKFWPWALSLTHLFQISKNSPLDLIQDIWPNSSSLTLDILLPRILLCQFSKELPNVLVFSHP